MAVYLIDHKPTRSQFRTPRRAKPSGVIVVHTAENTPDYVAFDGGAEAVAKFIQKRTDPGSYHELVDSDSAVQMVRYGDEAFHDATGSNLHSLSVSIATRADVWPLAPRRWRDGAIEQAALAAVRQARWVKDQTGIVIPAERITREESEQRRPGFISHGQRDPGRRTDPGAGFPWAQFLSRFKALSGQATSAPAPTPSPRPPGEIEDDDMPYRTIEIVDGTHKGKTYMVTPFGLVHVIDRDELKALQNGDIVDTKPPAPVHAKQLGNWFDGIAGNP